MVVDLSESEPLRTSSLLFPHSCIPHLLVSISYTNACLAVDTSSTFWSPDVKVGERALFQLAVSAPADAHLSLLPFESLAISFGSGVEDEEVEGMAVEVESGDDAGSVEDVELGGSDDEEEDSDEEEESEEDSDDDEEEEDDDDDSDSGGFKMNGFIDDEAEEYSSDGDGDESE